MVQHMSGTVPVVRSCPRCGRGWIAPSAHDGVPYHQRPPAPDEQDDGIGDRPCGGSFGPYASALRRSDVALAGHRPPPATHPE